MRPTTLTTTPSRYLVTMSVYDFKVDIVILVVVDLRKKSFSFLVRLSIYCVRFNNIDIHKRVWIAL